MNNGDFLVKGNFHSILSKPVEPTNEWIKTNFKYQELEFYYRLFDESQNGPFKVTPGLINTYDKKIST